MKKKKIEVDYYPEIAKELVSLFKANLNVDEQKTNYEVRPLIGEISSALRTLIANGYDAKPLLQDYAQSVHTLHLDIAIIVENIITGKFEIIIFEIKKVSALGLTQLSQLIGYCLVSKAKFGVLVNVDKSISDNFTKILETDQDLTKIERITDSKRLIHNFGVMTWDSATKKFVYTNTGSLKTISQLVELVEVNLIEKC